MAHIHSVYDTDKHFSIDPITRVISNEFSTKNTIVQNDHNSERFTFELPRYIEGHDMAACDRVEVHYININAATKEESRGVYEVEDLQISPEDSSVVICSWLLSLNATKYEGTTSFLIRFACTTDGDFNYVWNTAIYSNIIVSKGIYNSELVIENCSDILEQWKEQLFGINDDGVRNVTEAQAAAVSAVETAANAKTQEVLASIPDDYVTLDANVTEYKKKVDGLANAIKGNLSGAVVRADDVSPVEHDVCVCVYSKNLFKNESITESGAEPWKATRILFDYPSGNYAFSADFAQTGEISTIQACAKDYLTGTTFYGSKTSVETNGKIAFNFTIPEGSNKAYIYFYSNYTGDSKNTTCAFTNIQIEEGTTPPEYTPYVDPASVTVTRCGKNILGYAEDFSITQDGLTIEYSANENIFTINGTPTKASFPINFGSHLFDKFSLPAGTNAALSIEHISGSLSAEKMTNVFYLGNSDSPNGGRNNWFSVPFPISGRKTNISTAVRKYFSHTWLYIGGEYDVTFTDYKFKIQLEIGNEPSNFEEFSGVKYTPTTDGTILNMTSLSPNMTLLTDSSAAIVECEYNRDSNAVIADLYNKLADLSATT